MRIYVVITDSSISDKVEPEHLCRIASNAYFVRSELGTGELSKTLGVSANNNGTVVLVEDIAGWESDSVTVTINQWLADKYSTEEG